MTWRETAEALRSLGYPRVETPVACAWDVEPPFYDALASRIAADLDSEPWLLVGHSGAGGVLPAVAEALPSGASAMVFVDAILPHPGKSWFETAPPDLSARLRERATDGRIPAWPDWFPAPVLAGLLPQAGVRAAFSAEAKAIPLRYLAEPAPTARVAPPTGCAYLQLSAGYEAEAGAGVAAGWTVARLSLHHLAMLTDPDRVAGALHSLIEALSFPSES
ncbi:MAG TPA: hypothetical protein VGL73_08595 [Caulobacteraceae bacterium]|jgi:hypothetical protein